MTLEERIAEAIAEANNGTTKSAYLWRDEARAVVAVLPTADVSDEDIAEALTVRVGLFQDQASLQSSLHANVRALLDAQAAAHAAELHGTVTTEYHNRMMNQAGAACDVLRAARDTASAEVEALRAEVERLNVAVLDEIDNRDRAVEWADRLACALAPSEVIGEHTSSNDPWANALAWKAEQV